MKETTQIKNDLEIVSQVKQNQEKQTKFIGRLLPQSGHKCFELNIKTGVISLAKFKEEAINFDDAKQGIISTTKKVIINENCKYVTALNKKNAVKHFNNLLKKQFEEYLKLEKEVEDNLNKSNEVTESKNP